MKDRREDFKETVLEIIEIQNEISYGSTHFDSNLKSMMINLGNDCKIRIQNESFTLTQLKSILSDLLTFWNESIGVDTELFWTELQKKNIDIKRKDELIFTLAKGRFRRVDIGYLARNSWQTIKKFDSIQNRFSTEEIDKIDKIIELDEKTRLDMLIKCLKEKKIPQSQYLKFGECMKYFAYCSLLDKYFSELDIKYLYDIWRKFKVK